MTKIKELTPRQGNVNVEGVITEVGEARTFNKFGRPLVVANAILKDDSGSVKLTLWNDDAGRYKAGDKIKVTNGYVGEFQGEKQLTSGKFGKIEKVGEGEIEENVDEKAEVSADDEELEDAPVAEVIEEEAEEPEGVEKIEEEEF
ncbi:MAG: OB-fold nucleic acid binding domain-containing protein [Candidatus Nanoarchaeia archaeon]|nr:OB-fold nucleic acid binding domain-containing protein [Candidatus Nanoarchaeia archaeon]MDD5740509.1 OB-fold nucleic acid binding domain-containing protein [Candidatus Nanoarchaeia archaeon]